MTGDRDPVAQRLTNLPWALAASGLALVIGAGLAWFAAGRTAALGIAAGIGLVVFSYTFSCVLIAVADVIRPALVLPVGLSAYVVKFATFGFVMAGLAERRWEGLVPMGVGIVAAGVAWSIGQVVWLVRTQHPYRQVKRR